MSNQIKQPLIQKQEDHSSSDSEPDTPPIDVVPSKIKIKRKNSVVNENVTKKDSTVICELCAEEKAVKWCPKCDGPQCEACFQTLHKRKYKSHIQYACSMEVYQSSIEQMNTAIPCPQHESLSSNIVCFDCNTMICLACAKDTTHR
jgi:hypothetical protein